MLPHCSHLPSSLPLFPSTLWRGRKLLACFGGVSSFPTQHFLNLIFHPAAKTATPLKKSSTRCWWGKMKNSVRARIPLPSSPTQNAAGGKCHPDGSGFKKKWEGLKKSVLTRHESSFQRGERRMRPSSPPLFKKKRICGKNSSGDGGGVRNPPPLSFYWQMGGKGGKERRGEHTQAAEVHSTKMLLLRDEREAVLVVFFFHHQNKLRFRRKWDNGTGRGRRSSGQFLRRK